MISSASNFASHVDHLFKFLFISCSFITALVWFAIIYFCFRYRRSAKIDRSLPPEKSNLIEYSVMGFILVFGVFIFTLSARLFLQMRQSPKDAIEVNVIAKQWMWIFHDQKIGDQTNILRLPVGRPAKLIMTSIDVIHSFYVPAFRVKQDIVPGMYTSLWFTPNQIGSFEILCAQYCGLNHSAMRGVVEVVSQADYDATQFGPNARSDLQNGKNLFLLKGCVGCHDGSQKIGPSLKNIFNSKVQLADGREVLVDENYLRRSILEPNVEIVKGFPEVMPTYKGVLDEEQILALIEYIKQESPR